MSITTNIIAAGMAAAALGACASGGPKTPDQNPAILAAVQAEPRVIAGETTWVTRGPGYDIVGFTKKDIADVDSAVARESKAFSDVFGAAPPRVVASVHRVTIGDGDPAYQPEPPLPPGDLAPVVEVPVVVRTGNANSRNQVSGGRYGGAGAAGGAPGVDAIPTERVARAWLSARATALTGHPGTQGSTGLIDDPRVPGWAEALVPDLAAQDTTIGRLSVALTADNVGVLPLQQFFTMDRPQATYADAAESGPGAGRGGEGGGGYGGGMGGGGYGGGRGGMGGMGGGRGGMGGMRGGRGGGGGRATQRQAPPLRGAALYEAQATVLGHYLMVRQGAPLIGQLVDAQIRNQPVDSVLAKQQVGPRTVAQLDADWRQWLSARGESARASH